MLVENNTTTKHSEVTMSNELKLELHNFTARQYAILILRDDFNYSWQRCGNKLDITREAARELYKRADQKDYIIRYKK